MLIVLPIIPAYLILDIPMHYAHKEFMIKAIMNIFNRTES